MLIEEGGVEAVVYFEPKDLGYSEYLCGKNGAVRKTLLALLDASGPRPWTSLALDFAQTPFVSSEALGLFITLQKKCQAKKVAMTFRHVLPEFYEVLDFVKLNKFFTVEDPPPLPRQPDPLPVPPWPPVPETVQLAPADPVRGPVRHLVSVQRDLARELRLAHLNLAKKWLS